MAGTGSFPIEYLPLGGAAVLLVLAALSDIYRYLIPNRLCLALAALFAVYAVLAGLSGGSILARSSIGLVVLVAGLGIHARGLVGGGDVKLLAALTLWIAPYDWPLFMLGTMAVGGVLALLVLLLRKTKVWLPDFLLAGSWSRHLLDDKAGIPYGVAISIAGLISISRGL